MGGKCKCTLSLEVGVGVLFLLWSRDFALFLVFAVRCGVELPSLQVGN